MSSKRLFLQGTILFAILASGRTAIAEVTDLEKLFTTPLPDKSVAYMSLTFSGVLVRTPEGTILIDPANLMAETDIAFLPTGAPSPTASPDDALRMALDVRPRTIVLMHGSDAQHADFVKKAKAKLPGTVVEIPEPFTSRVLTLK